jgi:hypothetical protein
MTASLTHKTTGTTFLQEALCGHLKEWKIAKSIMLRDNMVYLGSGGHLNPWCLRHETQSFFSQNVGISAMMENYPDHPEIGGPPTMNAKFVSIVEAARKAGQNALVVFECFSEYSK